MSRVKASAAFRAVSRSVRKARICGRDSFAMRAGKWRLITSSHVLSINWNDPVAVDRGFLAVSTPELSASIRRSRKIAMVIDGFGFLVFSLVDAPAVFFSDFLPVFLGDFFTGSV
ncbi:MAG: hypothetical protein AAFO62_05335 [Pseudomonadota bacterium]